MKEITDEEMLELLLWISNYAQCVDYEQFGLPIDVTNINSEHNQEMIQLIKEFLNQYRCRFINKENCEKILKFNN